MSREQGEARVHEDVTRVQALPRFDCETETRGHGYMAYDVAVMEEWDDGEWVRYEDVQAVLDRLQASEQALHQAREQLARAEEGPIDWPEHVYAPLNRLLADLSQDHADDRLAQALHAVLDQPPPREPASPVPEGEQEESPVEVPSREHDEWVAVHSTSPKRRKAALVRIIADERRAPAPEPPEEAQEDGQIVYAAEGSDYLTVTVEIDVFADADTENRQITDAILEALPVEFGAGVIEEARIVSPRPPAPPDSELREQRDVLVAWGRRFSDAFDHATRVDATSEDMRQAYLRQQDFLAALDKPAPTEGERRG